MKVAIRMTERYEKKALPILLRHSPGMVLADRTYVLEAAAVVALHAAGVKFTELAREGALPQKKGAFAGERI